jgi:SAM-dependent methyltransferase
MRRVSAEPLPYRDFYYPLNVFMHILTAEEGGVTYLHYGLFDHPGQPIGAAQERSTELLLARLPAPPARILDVGAGVGTTLALLTRLGYDVVGITPDEKQVAWIRARYGSEVRVENRRFEDYAEPVDAIVFQESSQYIESQALFARAATLTPHIIVLDEFALRPTGAPGELHAFDAFLEAASQHGFGLTEEIDLSSRAAPTVDYFNVRIPRYRDRLMNDLGLSAEQLDDLVASGVRYRQLYSDGVYGYRLLQFRRSRG